MLTYVFELYILQQTDNIHDIFSFADLQSQNSEGCF